MHENTPHALSSLAVTDLSDVQSHRWLLTLRDTAYVLGTDPNGHLIHVYWGPRLPFETDYPTTPTVYPDDVHLQRRLDWDEYPSAAGFHFTEPALKVTFADGVRDVRLRFESADVLADSTQSGEANHLVLTLRDEYYPARVHLHYHVHAAYNILERWAVIVNEGEQPFTLEAALSATWQLPTLTEGAFRLTHLSGRWASETLARQVVLPVGRTSLESRRGLSSREANPFCMIDVLREDGGATETSGRVWFTALAWTGNWKMSCDVVADPYRLTLSAGVNDYDFAWQVQPGERFTTPPCIGGLTDHGFGAASRNLHAYQREVLIPRNHATDLRPVLYNSWEAVGFSVTEAAQRDLAARAAQLGVELFVVDDGWFGKRNSDSAGLGDWHVNPEKFPNGLQPLIDEVHALGMRFGLWVEPEMVNPASDLYHAHPEWVYHYPTRPRVEERNQLVLNLARDDVAAFILQTLDTLLTQNAIDYIKWDFNRSLTELGWPSAPLASQREATTRHILALYQIVETLRNRHQSVLWEVCAGGGGRADLGALSRFDQCWTSDNTDPYDRLAIQEGFSLAYPAKTMAAWVSPSPMSLGVNNDVVTMRYRFHSAMMGVLGIGDDLRTYTPQRLATAAALIEEYKQIRAIVQDGDLYRLISPRHNPHSATQYVSQDGTSSVLFVFQHRQHYWQTPPIVYPQGLHSERRYTIAGLAEEAARPSRSGEALMQLGIHPQLNGHFGSVLLRIQAV